MVEFPIACSWLPILSKVRFFSLSAIKALPVACITFPNKSKLVCIVSLSLAEGVLAIAERMVPMAESHAPNNALRLLSILILHLEIILSQNNCLADKNAASFCFVGIGTSYTPYAPIQELEEESKNCKWLTGRRLKANVSGGTRNYCTAVPNVSGGTRNHCTAVPNVSGGTRNHCTAVPNVSGGTRNYCTAVPNVSGGTRNYCTAVPNVSGGTRNHCTAVPNVSGGTRNYCTAVPNVSGGTRNHCTAVPNVSG